MQLALLVDARDEYVLAFRPDRLATVRHGSGPVHLSELLARFNFAAEELFAALRQG